MPLLSWKSSICSFEAAMGRLKVLEGGWWIQNVKCNFFPRWTDRVTGHVNPMQVELYLVIPLHVAPHVSQIVFLTCCLLPRIKRVERTPSLLFALFNNLT